MAKPSEILVVSGPNGSGKTTLAVAYAADLDYPYLGADAIAASLAPHDPGSQRISAGKQFSAELQAMINQRQSVVVESTLSGRTFVRPLNLAKSVSFSITLVHLFLDSADICVARVAERVEKGGHNVPEEDIRRRFTRCAANFWNLYRPLCDRWLLMYNTTTDAQIVAEGDPTNHTIQDNEIFEHFLHIVHHHE